MSKDSVKTVWVGDDGTITVTEEARVVKKDEDAPVVLSHSFKPVADDDDVSRGKEKKPKPDKDKADVPPENPVATEGKNVEVVVQNDNDVVPHRN